MTSPAFALLPTDRPFPTSLEAGHPDCLCSRCLLLIGERELPIRMWPKDARYELRFHPACLGFDTFDDDDDEEWDDDPFDDDDDDDDDFDDVDDFDDLDEESRPDDG